MNRIKKNLAFFCLIVMFSVVLSAQGQKLTVAIFDPSSSGTSVDAGTIVTVREMISSTFVNTGRYIIVERSLLQQVMKEQNFSNTDMVDENQATELGRLAGANKVVLSAVTLSGNRNMLSIKLIDVKTAAIEQQKTKVVASNELLDLIESLTLELIKDMSKEEKSFTGQKAMEEVPKEKKEAGAKAKEEQGLAEQKAREEKELAERKAREEKELAEAKAKEAERLKAEEEKRLAERKAKEEQELAEAKAKEAERLKMEEEKRLAERKAREERELAERKAREEQELAERKAREERELAERKAREEKLKAEEEKRVRQEKAKIFLEGFPNTIEFSAFGGKETIFIHDYENPWELLETPSWCSIQKTGKSLILTCNSNTNPDLREGSFSLLTEEQSKKILIKQKGLTFLEKGDWKQALNKVMHNGGITSGSGLYKGERSHRGIRNGLGVYFFVSDNESYWGDFLQGESSGKGIYIIGKEGDYHFSGCRGCKYYAGNWSSDLKNGLGKCYDRRGEMLYYGYFHNDKPTEKFPQSHDESYKFECIEYHNGDRYLGETYQGLKHGLGIFFLANGDAWYGEWKDGKRNGNGIEFQYSGTMKAGRWSDDNYLE